MRSFKLALAFLFLLASAAMAGQPIKSASSGNVAAATATATLTGGAQSWTYLTGFEITYGGATAAACVNATITGLLGGTATYVICAPAGVAVGGVPLTTRFNPPLQSAAVNTNIVVSMPTLGAGNTNAAIVAHGYVE